MLDDDRAIRKATKRYRDAERVKALNRRDVIRALAQHKSGREFLYWLLELGHLGKNPFSTNALATAFSCGEANISQQVQAEIIEAAPNDYMLMLKEQEDARRAYDTAADDERSTELGEPGDEATGADEA